MAKRVCYIHIGPHKSGTTSIQWFLKENRAELLKEGYLVPESEDFRGGHYQLVTQLCGRAVPQHQREAAARFASAIKDTKCEAVVISSETLDDLLVNEDCAREFFGRIEELNLEPKLVFFPRNQSQLLNSRYTEVVKCLHRSEPFEAFVQAEIRHPNFRYAHWIALANAFCSKLIAQPFTEETITRGVVPEFLRAIDIDPSHFHDVNVRRNRGVGPFTISVARDVLRSLGSEGRELTWLQVSRCGLELAAYLDEKGLADSGYCGLTTALARHIETEWRSDNDAFAQEAWGRSWAEVFAVDVGREFKPNDFDICPPGWAVRRRLRRAVREMKAMVQEVLLDPTLAIEAWWNDLRKRNNGFPENIAPPRDDAIHLPMATYPKSPKEMTKGMMYFPRMLDKIRLHLRNELHEDYRENFGALKAVDGVCCNFLRVHHRDLIERVKQGGTDDEILEWCFERGRRLNHGDLFVWNGFASKFGWRDSITPRLEERKKEMGIADRNDIQCIPDLIDFDEGRKS